MGLGGLSSHFDILPLHLGHIPTMTKRKFSGNPLVDPICFPVLCVAGVVVAWCSPMPVSSVFPVRMDRQGQVNPRAPPPQVRPHFGGGATRPSHRKERFPCPLHAFSTLLPASICIAPTCTTPKLLSCDELREQRLLPRWCPYHAWVEICLLNHWCLPDNKREKLPLIQCVISEALTSAEEMK